MIAGTDLTYTLTVYTAGPNDALGVTVSDPLPAGTSFVSASAGGAFSNGTVTWDLGTFAASASDTTLKLVVRVDAAQSADLIDTAFVSSTHVRSGLGQQSCHCEDHRDSGGCVVAG